MNSIISPWVFYWIGIVDSIRILLIAILIVLVIVVAIMFMCTMSDADDYGFKNKNVVEEAKLCIKVAIATFVVAVLVCVVPSEDTCYKMLAAKMFTQDNINNATEYVTDVIDYAVDKVKELQPNTEE
jgi:ABC-type microcin C transport system permease subunit YejB